nr:DUF501 domain-containing protein [Candidatus Solincola tengchongensis]
MEDILERGALSEEDRRVAERQLGRQLRGEVRVASRCPHGKVQVIATSPILDDGTPFPTLFWLSCPLLQKEVSRLESGDLRERLRRLLRADEAFASALRGAEEEYRGLREEWAERMGRGEEVRGFFSSRTGIGGTVAGGLKCLHAHLAHYLAGGENPVGAEVFREIENLQELRCPGDCEPFLGRGR